MRPLEEPLPDEGVLAVVGAEPLLEDKLPLRSKADMLTSVGPHGVAFVPGPSVDEWWICFHRPARGFLPPRRGFFTNSLTKWVYDWTVFLRHRSCRVGCFVAGDG
jgi:hypothetical protein